MLRRVKQWLRDVQEVRANVRAMHHRLCHLQHKIWLLERGLDKIQNQVNNNAMATTERHCDHDQRLRTLEVINRIEGMTPAPLGLDFGNDELEPPHRRSWEN